MPRKTPAPGTRRNPLNMFAEAAKARAARHAPLAARMRPRSLEEFVGQRHLVGEGRMLRRAIEEDGQALPFRDGTFDCAVAIKVLNHVSDRLAFSRESRRVIRAGPLVFVHATKETIAGNWTTHCVPSFLTQERFEPEAVSIATLEQAGFSKVEVSHIRYEDMADGSAQALKRFPETFLTEERIMNTSLFSRLPEAERGDVLAAIRRDYASCRLQEVIAEYARLSEKGGDGAIFVACP